ncbi:AMP-binding acetyl-CoA synthetase [Halioglobus japonicus]|uniref:AMP-binding acetyl-CoA synthetase n=2 Tax=Halioglobus TaxID=1217416 RepID=A0AAP8SNF8_9GAMM|nr:AMP-binding protein [Halioglobus japonicus]AQA18557.1 AMP-binding acetyl-CoA synthetase [Halioglobus japonicus]PLW86582.1 AMP-binding acetyl-CoA synthetase [Halioglobus japonicus]GHD12133.1 AMP-binding protein [Halioglobus japonicus]
MTQQLDALVLQAAVNREQRHPDRVFMTQPINGEAVDYTWAQTMDEARRMAAHINSLDLPANSNIAMISKNCAHFIIAELAIWMAGHCTVALYPTLNAETVNYILDHSEAKLIFVGKLDGWEAMEPGVPADMPRIALPLAPANDYPKWDDIIAKQAPIDEVPVWPAEQRALICYTSGSTGRPKGVAHSFQSISAPASLQGDVLEINESDRIISYLPLAHVMERALVEAGSIYQGVHIFFAEELDTFLADLRRARPTLFISVPRLWLKFQSGVFQKFPEEKLNLLLKIPVVKNIIRKKVLDGLGLGSVRMAASGSAPIPPDLIRWYDKLGLKIMEGYGMTEDFAYSHMSTEGMRAPGTVGHPAVGVDARISDVGEIEVKSPGLMMGYYKAPELTAEVMTEDGYFKTGDRGVYDGGLLCITGRVKELFKTSKGKYVAPVPLENLLSADGWVEQSCVSGPGRPACYATLQLAEGLRDDYDDPAFRTKASAHFEKLMADVNAQVENYEALQFLAVVREPWQVENDFLTPTLKIKRNVIEEAYEPYLDRWYASGQKVVWQD